MGVKPGRRQAVAYRHGDAEEVYVIVSGSGRIKLDDEVRDVKPMDAIRMAPNVLRAVEAGPLCIEYLAFGRGTRATERPSRSRSSGRTTACTVFGARACRNRPGADSSVVRPDHATAFTLLP